MKQEVRSRQRDVRTLPGNALLGHYPMMDQVARLEATSRELHLQAERMERIALRQFGIVHVDREPGFPCWTLKDGDGSYHNTPREALAAMVTNGKES